MTDPLKQMAPAVRRPCSATAFAELRYQTITVVGDRLALATAHLVRAEYVVPAALRRTVDGRKQQKREDDRA